MKKLLRHIVLSLCFWCSMCGEIQHPGTCTSIGVPEAHAVPTSTINPAVPATNTPLSSAVFRGQYLAAYNDINALWQYAYLNTAPPTTGASILAGNNAGGFNNVILGSGLSYNTGTDTLSVSAPPGGTNGQVQYNNAGILGGFTVSGDLTINTSTGVATLPTVQSSPGSYGSTSVIPQFTVDTKGRITNISNQNPIQAPAANLTGIGLPSNIVSSFLTSVGTLINLTVTNPIVGSILGNAATVTTNANLTGPITSVGNATSIASQTGTGSTLVTNTSPTIITPTFSGTATGSISGNAATVTTNANLTGDTISTGNATTTQKVNGVVYAASPSTNTVPVVTSANTVTYEALPNSAMANSSTTVNGQSCVLGSSCTTTSAPSGSAGGDLASTYPNPSVAKVNGVTYAATPSTHTVPVITASNTATYKTLPNCLDSAGQHINYTQSTDTFSCGTSAASAVTSVAFAGDGVLLSSTPSTPVTSSGNITDTLAAANGGTVFANGGLTAATPTYTTFPVLGVPGVNANPQQGSLGFANQGTNGQIVTVQNLHATTAYAFNLPATAGTGGYFLTSQGGGASDMIWTNPATIAAATAAALAANGTNCPPGSYPLGVDASGNSESCTNISSVTNDAQTKAAIVPNTAPSAGQILVGNAGGTAYAPVTAGGDCTVSSTGSHICTKTNGSAFVASATTDTTNGSNISSGTVGTARLPANQIIRNFGCNISGGGSLPTTGTYCMQHVPFGMTISGWYVDANASCTVTVDVQDLSATSFPGGSGNKPTLTAATTGNAAISSWTTSSFSANQGFQFNLSAVSGSCNYINIMVYGNGT